MSENVLSHKGRVFFFNLKFFGLPGQVPENHMENELINQIFLLISSNRRIDTNTNQLPEQFVLLTSKSCSRDNLKWCLVFEQRLTKRSANTKIV